MSDQWQYLLLMASCLAVTLPLEFVLGARVYRQHRRAAVAIAPAFALFAVWDWIAIVRGDWWFAARYVSGIRLGAMPVEELAFFLAVPLCTLLTFEAVRSILARTTRDA